MRSEMMEFLRFGSNASVLEQGREYLAVSGAKPVRKCSTSYGHADYFDDFGKLRYSDSVSEQERTAALVRLAAEATQMLGSPHFGVEPTQVDLVISAAELWLLPFEAANDGTGVPLFTQREKPLVLTRRIRGEFKERAPSWSPVPRIALISASPKWAGPSVPLTQHKDAIRASLKAWVEPLEGYEGVADDRKVLHILEHATPEDVRDLFQKAKDKPFTHVHILAHGMTKANTRNPLKSQMGFALATKEERPMDADFLVEALSAQGMLPQVVTLAVCDGASQANTVVPYESLAQRLHLAGVPIVVGSQLPLTFEGSVLLAKEFYKHMGGKDVREVLHGTRVALYEERERLHSHDWMSMVSYVQLPEGYSNHLRRMRLEACLGKLKVAQGWADQVAKCGPTSQHVFLQVKESLQERIDELKDFLGATSTRQNSNDPLYQENAGLLGSAYKRLAELLEVQRRRDPNVPVTEIRDALQQSHKAYRGGYETNLSHHWTGVQWLSLEAVLSGVIEKPGCWYAAMQAAQLDAERPDEHWAWGSIAELWLLAICATKEDGYEQAKQALTIFKQRVAKSKDEAFAIESTRRQMNRYVTWWTKVNGFFPQAAADLSAPAQQLMKALDS